MQGTGPATHAALASSIDMHRLLALANQQFGRIVDWDMRGSSITQIDALMFSAYGPAVTRAMNAVASRGPGAISRSDFETLARTAFIQATDRYFNGSDITDYGMVLSDDGYGQEVYKLACIVAEDPSRVSHPPAETGR